MFSKKFSHFITCALLVIGLICCFSAVVTLVIWFTDMTASNFLTFAGSISVASLWLLLAKLSYYIDGKLTYPDEEEPDPNLPTYLED